MILTERILQHLKALPQSLQAELLDFIEHLESKAAADRDLLEDNAWSRFSLSQARHDVEEEAVSYSLDDLKEVF